MNPLTIPFDTSDFIPHGHCYLWQPRLIWLHVVADGTIALSYYSIPLLLLYFTHQRKDVPFPWFFQLFGAFIVACGTTHLLDIWTLWHPAYWLSGEAKAITAILSVATVIVFLCLLPKTLLIPGVEEWRRVTESLKAAERIAGIGHWEYDTQTEAVTWSQSLFTLFSLPVEGSAPSLREQQKLFQPASWALLCQVISSAVENGKPYTLELQSLKAPDREAIWLLARGEAVKNAAGQVVKLMGTVLDITDRKKYEQEILNLSDRLQMAVQSGAIAIWDWNVVENILTWDDRMYELYGITPAAFTNVYESWASRLHPDDRQDAEAAVLKAFTESKAFDYEFRVIHPNGTIHFLKAYALVRCNDQGEPQHLIGINYDITDLKEAEQVQQRLALDLKRSNHELQEFASIASHDLQEPLRGIINYTEMLSKRYKGQLDESADRWLDYVVEGASRLQRLIQDLLTYSKVGQNELKQRPIDCNDLLKEVQTNLHLVIAEKHAVINVQPLPVVWGDSIQLFQVFQNLISNALKYHGEKAPRIEITASPLNGEWLFCFQDEGIGLDAAYADRIFEIFRRLHTREEYDGTGLGLAICKKIVERHGGRIWVKSQLGEGAAFYFTLPLLPSISSLHMENHG